MAQSKWERILELEAKPKTLETHLVDEAAKLLASELRGTFPPETGGFHDAREEAKFAPLFQEPRTRPGEGVYRAGFHLARLDLNHELEEHALYLREERFKPFAPGEHDKLALLLLSRWLTEQLFALKEQLHTPLKRARLVEILDKAELILLGPKH
ncbi:MAG: hypothetical protein JST54_26140 [Deltaproteobacteria bacterium]|nr:hypothetical protein [Deltaproteobacteria bacterium]